MLFSLLIIFQVPAKNNNWNTVKLLFFIDLQSYSKKQKMMTFRIMLTGLALILGFSAFAQINNSKNSAKRKTEDRTNRKVDETIDKGLNKIEQGINNILKKKEKTEEKPSSLEMKTKIKNENSGAPEYDPPVTATDEQGNTDYTAYKSFNFMAGDSILFYEDFVDKSKKRWNAYDIADLNIVHHENKNWLEVKSGQFYPIELKTLPENFTLEFDVFTPDNNTGTLDIRFICQSQADRLADPYLDNSGLIHFSPITQKPKTGLGGYIKKVNGDEVNPLNEFHFYSWQPELAYHYARISLSCINNKVSVWVNKEQVMDDIDLLVSSNAYFLTFHLQNYFVAENRMYLTNFRLATGNANPKLELATKKKFVTQNIYFDVNSDVIRPNSYSVLKQIAASIQAIDEDILIVGHTDSDGTDEANLVLSQKRAAAVKRALVNEFGIDEDRLTTGGKGESVPLNRNTTPAGKAQNRRVEFIKQ